MQLTREGGQSQIQVKGGRVDSLPGGGDRRGHVFIVGHVDCEMSVAVWHMLSSRNIDT